MSWTDERIAVLKKMWGEGKTAAEIAAQLGDVTRNAVIGKAHRLKLSNRLSPIQQNNKKPAPKIVEEKKPSRKISTEERLADIEVKRLSLAELKDKMCRWPIGDPKEDGFSFCGQDAVTGVPYCDDHASIAYQTVSRNRILQAKDFEEKETDRSSEDDVKEVAVA